MRRRIYKRSTRKPKKIKKMMLRIQLSAQIAGMLLLADVLSYNAIGLNFSIFELVSFCLFEPSRFIS